MTKRCECCGQLVCCSTTCPKLAAAFAALMRDRPVLKPEQPWQRAKREARAKGIK